MSEKTVPGYINPKGMQTVRKARDDEHPPVAHPYAVPYVTQCTVCKAEQVTNSSELHHTGCRTNQCI